MTDPCTCRQPWLYVSLTPHQVRCVFHWFEVPPLDMRVPKRPQAGSAAAKEMAR